MARKNRRNYAPRQSGQRRYRKLFVIVTEGAVTEPQYFARVKALCSQALIDIRCLDTGHKSAPQHLRTTIMNFIRENSLRKSDEAWVVVDRDQWTHDALSALIHWSQEEDNYGFAISNPKFEYWLLLHAENGNGINTIRQCHEHLKRHGIINDKHINHDAITVQNITNAIYRARQRDNNPREDILKKDAYFTTVYKLVENILTVSAD